MSTKICLNSCMTTVYCNFGFAHFFKGLSIRFAHSIQDFLLASDKKVAFYFIPFPYEEARKNFEGELDLLIDNADQIIILGSELHDITVEFIKKYQHPKIIHLLCGQIQGIGHSHWHDWINRTVNFYRDSSTLDALTPYMVKPKTFDILLGLSRPHRDILYNHINQNNLTNQVIMTYINHTDPIPMEDSNVWIWEDGITLPNTNIKWTVTPVHYQGKDMSLSQIIPSKIYNQTAYSVVAESNFSSEFVFTTEKIVKPILAERLFLLFGGVGYLQHLQNIGFKTFNGIIDESYDLETDYVKRGRMICEQIDYLIGQPQEEILTKIRPITEHNKNLILTTNWNYNLDKILMNL